MILNGRRFQFSAWPILFDATRKADFQVLPMPNKAIDFTPQIGITATPVHQKLRIIPLRETD